MPVADAASHPLVKAAIAAADAALAKPTVTPADADAVIAAFNALFAPDRTLSARGGPA